MIERLRRTIPHIDTDLIEITSRPDPGYNCTAWAAGDATIPWWPMAFDEGPHHWPDGVAREVTVAAFEATFRTLGYEPCADEAHEPGIEKVAIFQALPFFGPAHVSRQLPDGRWASKFGAAWDAVHATNRQLEGGEYGKVVSVLARPVAGPPPNPPS